MKKLLLPTFFLNCICLFAQTTKDYTMQIKISVQETPPSLLFQWEQDTTATSYTVSRKLKDATSWTTIAAGLSDTTTQFTDQNIATGDAYEYRFVKNRPTFSGTAYTYSGISAPAIERRGKIIILIDSVVAC